jgi:hypothetical protein
MRDLDCREPPPLDGGGKRGRDIGGPDEQTVNNPMAIAARDGTVHFVYCVEYMHCFYRPSDDDGVTRSCRWKLFRQDMAAEQWAG